MWTRVFLAAVLVVPAFAQTAVECRNLERRGKPEARSCFQKLSGASSPALRAEGFWGLGGYDQANEEFKLAVARDPKNAELRVRWGRLFLEYDQPADAKALFNEAIGIRKDYAPALLGLALAAAQSFESDAVVFAEMALKTDPKLVEAQELLARLALEDNNHPKAIAEADKAIAMSPEAVDAMAVRAAIDLLENKSGAEWFSKIAQVNPRYGKGYALAAHILVLNRRYEEGIANYRKALELDPNLHAARAQLGVNLMRLGLEDDARKELEATYNAGYKGSPTVTNSLTLIDSYKRFETFKTPKTIVKLDRKEAELLRPYVESELKRAIATYEKKYQLKLDKPVQVELYPNHTDFEVRTLGMPGLGALGVTFGSVVAMDSPSGRPPGSFHWASTLWHELSHVYVLTATKHRVPRWFTEGMAVHEETAVSPDWGDRLDPTVIRAIKENRLLPIDQLDRGFVRPSYPAQVIVSYFQAGRICDFINQKWGYGKLLEMMRAFGESKPTPEVVQSALGVKSEEFDKQFRAWLDAQVRPTVDGYEQWQKGMKALVAASRAGSHDEVIKEGKSITTIYPEFVEGQSAYEIVAEAFLAKGDKENARRRLEEYSKAGGRNPATLMKLATWQEEAGSKKDAIHTLERLIYIYPMDQALHQRLGDLFLAEANQTGAIREYTAVVASKPIDEAGARFNLARALHSAKRMEEAKEQLLMALEAAPGFRPAQKLLLEMSR